MSMYSTEYKPYPHTIHGHLFQAAMWRRDAAAWTEMPKYRWENGEKRHYPPLDAKRWVENILQFSRDECVRRARIHLAAARDINLCMEKRTRTR